MLVAVITGKTIDENIALINQANSLCDAFELRIDHLTKIDIPTLSQLRKTLKKPVIFTLRTKVQGGLFFDDHKKRWSMIEQLIQLNPDYFDIEHDLKSEFITSLHNQYPTVKLIRSYHDFNSTPNNLEAILEKLQHSACSVIKIVTYANSSIDVLRMLNFVQQTSPSTKIAAHCMGPIGIPSRVLGPVVGSCFQYASVDDKNQAAPGCLSLKQFCDDYRYRDINSDSKIYALLGDPVDKSIGHQFHNTLFKQQNINALYVKFKVTEHELNDFFTQSKSLPFKGFSVTMPLKIAVMPLFKRIDQQCEKICAANTIKVEHDYLCATNTDGQGVFNALLGNKSLAEKSVLILGAGGAARAIAYEAKIRDAKQIIIINRTLSKAHQLASDVGGEGYDFSVSISVLESCDFVINTLSSAIDTTDQIEKLITPCITKKNTYIDINYHSPILPLLDFAVQNAGEVVDGKAMFTEQALLQNQYWITR